MTSMRSSAMRSHVCAAPMQRSLLRSVSATPWVLRWSSPGGTGIGSPQWSFRWRTCSGWGCRSRVLDARVGFLQTHRTTMSVSSPGWSLRCSSYRTGSVRWSGSSMPGRAGGRAGVSLRSPPPRSSPWRQGVPPPPPSPSHPPTGTERLQHSPTPRPPFPPVAASVAASVS